MLRTLLLSLSAVTLLLLPAVAQQHERGGGRGAAGQTMSRPQTGQAPRSPQIFRGGPRGPMNWGDFHHDNAPARIAPHRFLDTNLPRANGWRGNARDFNLRTWQGGGWQHVSHGGRFGWWWVVGPDWYYFDRPVYPYPDLYTPYNTALGWWYWCDPLQEYYPYVTSCPVPWESVMPQE